MATQLPLDSYPENSEVKYPVNKRRVKLLEPLLLLAPAGFWLLLMLVLPTLIIFQLSLVPGIRPGELVNPGGVSSFWEFILRWGEDGYLRRVWFALTENYRRILDPLFLQVIWRSLILAASTSIICLFLGFPVAYWITQIAPKRWRTLLLLGFVLPLWTSSLLRTYAWITILRPSGLLNLFLNSLGLPSLQILDTLPAVVIGMSYSLLPYMVLILYASLEKLDTRLLEAAADLGANPFQTFWRVTIPQVRTGIFAGGFIVLITALGDFVNPELLGGVSSMTAARLIYTQFLGASKNWGFGSALSMTLIFAVSIAIALLIKFGDTSVRSK